MNSTQLLKVKSIAMDSANNGITISDAQNDNRLIYVNEGFTRLTGYTEADILGTNCRFLQYPESGQEAVGRIAKAVAAGEFVREEIVNYKKDGSRFHNRLSITPVFDNAGILTHFIGIQEDITLEKEMENMERELANQKLVLDTTHLAEDKERRLLGEELHDNVNQLLAVTKLYLKIAADSEEQRMAMLEESQTTLVNAMEEIRKLSRRLTGPDVNDELQVSLEDLVKSVETGASFKIVLRTEPAAEALLSSARKLMIYRVVQEQLSNIIKYAASKTVTILVAEKNKEVTLSIKDDGCGFDATLQAEGIGLKNMKHRAERVDGSLQVITAPGMGCEIKIVFVKED